ncbi:MAG TPA: HEAT repeat domain-containing protein [Clostridiaceae bacterium]|nr:HEAT repeat domain-containing protein [Clostridiaceae bacterium]
MHLEAEEVFNSYNEFAGYCYENYMKEIEKKTLNGKEFVYKEHELLAYVNEQLQSWVTMPIDSLGGITPLQFFQNIKGLDNFIEVFKIGSKICVDVLPDVFIDALKGYGQEAVERLFELAVNKDFISDMDENYAIPLMAIKILSLWKEERAVPVFIDLLMEIDEDNELFLESIKQALVDIGEKALMPIFNSINTAPQIGVRQEYLIMALSEVGRYHRSDFIYKCLKDSFRRMENKVMGALCLAGYGDGRAIPALRGYVLKNYTKLDRNSFLDFLWAIEELGGEIQDLKQFMPAT